jgi:histidine triad (HIT) family protein
MSDCLFCRIVRKEIPSSVLYETDHILAFHDIQPQAPVHALVVTKKHFSTLNDIGVADASLLSELLRSAQEVAKQLNLDQKGYRSVINTNSEGGQSVYHLHLHLLGGRQLGPSMVG